MGRKANGEGSIHYRSGDGRWAASLSLGDGRRKHFLGKTRQEVATKLAAAQRSRQEGLPVTDDRLTAGRYLADWLETARSYLRPRTWTRYEELLRLHVLPAIGSMRLARVGPQELQALYGRALANGLSPTTVRQLHAVLHKSLKQAVAWGNVARNAADYVQQPRATRREMKTLTPGEVRRLFEAAEGTKLEALFVLAATSGMRQGELLGLRWEDVDLDTAKARVRRSLQRCRQGFVFAEPKSDRSRRQVLLADVAVSALRRHRVAQTEERLRRGPAWEDCDLVFTNASGRPIEVTNLTLRHFRPLLAKAGLPLIRFHDLRHTAATLMLAQNVNPKIVSEMLGHSQISITMDLYQHVTETMQREAARAIDAILRA
jgi:integrase